MLRTFVLVARLATNDRLSEDRLFRRFQPGFSHAVGTNRFNIRPEIEGANLAPFATHLITQRLGCTFVHGAVFDHHAVVTRTINSGEISFHIGQHERGVAFQWIAPAAATPGIEVQQIAFADLDAIALGR